MYLHMHQRVITPCLQRDPSNDVQGVNDVTQRFAHLSSMGVPHHCMQINLQQKSIIIII